MATSPQSCYLARVFRSVGAFIEDKPYSAHALGGKVELIGFANSERHLGLIAREYGADIEEMPGGDLFINIDRDGFCLRFYLCKTPEGGK